ncbi:MAG: ABC transporter ATP-binding protein [Aggregatilineales bacterium]
MTTIRLHDINKTYEMEKTGPTRTYGDRPSFVTSLGFGRPKDTRRAGPLNSGKLPEPPRPQALSHVTLEIRSGETMGILGPSGCGKTTLLKVIAGLIQPDSGTITYDGEDVTNVLPGERRIGIVFQDYALYPHMLSEQNIGFFFQMHNRAEEIPERVKQVSAIMGIGFDQLLSRKPPTLSGGERQRVAVARCIARDPRIFLFDEPLSNLDAKLRTQTRIELKRLLDRFRVTSVYVTHDQIEAIALCDRLALMRDGQIQQVGPYIRLIEQPVNTFVAGFLGIPPMNLFEGYWTQTGWQGRAFEWPLPPEQRQTAGRHGVLGVRPEQVTIAADAPLSGTVSLIEPLVSERVVLVHLGIGQSMCVARVPHESPASAVRLDETVHFGFDSARLMLFDGLSGKRL